MPSPTRPASSRVRGPEPPTRNGVPGSGGDTELYFVTDGVLTREFPEGATVVSVFEPV